MKPVNETSSAKSAEVEQLFGSIATRYDFINDVQSFGLHRFWKNRLVAWAAVCPGERALDVCTGTGDVAFALARKGIEVVGFDFSEEMLQVARQRQIQRAGCPVQFVRGDALKMPFENATFDCVTISYGLRNLASVREGLAEMLRVLKPAGRLLVLDFGKPRNRAWRALYFSYLRAAVPFYGKIFCGNWSAYAYILDSLLTYPAQLGVDQMLTELGCQDCQIHNFLGGTMSINSARKFQ